jgi:hypothetical protein
VKELSRAAPRSAPCSLRGFHDIFTGRFSAGDSIGAMKLSLIMKVGMAAVGAVFLVWVGVMIFAGSGSSKTEAVKDDQHCPVCGRELPPAYVGSGKCPYCQAREARGEKVAKPPGPPLTRSLAVPAVLVGLFCGLLITNVVMFFRARTARRAAEASFHLKCPKCMRKIRYRESQIGRLACCPLCRRPIVFPRPAGWEPPVSRWVKMKRWLKITHG